jgi:hypothetical protein
LPQKCRFLFRGDILYYLEWVKNLHFRGLEEGVPSMPPPQLPPCAGAYPSGRAWKELGMLNHLPGLRVRARHESRDSICQVTSGTWRALELTRTIRTKCTPVQAREEQKKGAISTQTETGTLIPSTTSIVVDPVVDWASVDVGQ